MWMTGSSIIMGQGVMSPQYLWRRNIRGNVPPNILETMSFRMSTRVTATVVCCILTQILYVVSQKALSYGGLHPPDPLPGLRGPQTLSFLLCPPIILWDRRPWWMNCFTTRTRIKRVSFSAGCLVHYRGCRLDGSSTNTIDGLFQLLLKNVWSVSYTHLTLPTIYSV